MSARASGASASFAKHLVHLHPCSAARAACVGTIQLQAPTTNPESPAAGALPGLLDQQGGRHALKAGAWWGRQAGECAGRDHQAVRVYPLGCVSDGQAHLQQLQLQPAADAGGPSADAKQPDQFSLVATSVGFVLHAGCSTRRPSCKVGREVQSQQVVLPQAVACRTVGDVGCCPLLPLWAMNQLASACGALYLPPADLQWSARRTCSKSSSCTGTSPL